MHDLTICEVTNRKDLARFIRFPQTLYKDDPNWVCPLFFEQKERFSNKNPFFQHARWQAWIALRDGRPVGRISAQIDDLHLEKFQDHTGHFGCLEAVDEQPVFDALFETAESWLRSQGMDRATGPFNLSINEECGLHIDGFDTPPRIMMVHGRPYYGQAVEAAGYRKAVDLIAYHQHPDFVIPKVMQRLVQRVADRVRIRTLNRRRLADELELMRDIFNDAWSENWGMVPITASEFEEAGKMMTMLIDDDFVQIAEVDGEPAQHQRGDPRHGWTAASVRLAQTPLAAEGALSEERPHSADGSTQEVSPHQLRTCPVVHDYRCAALPGARARHPGNGNVLDTGTQ